MSRGSIAGLIVWALVWFGLVVSLFIVGDLAPRDSWGIGWFVVALAVLLLALWPALSYARTPYQIALTEDGLCEFRSLLRRSLLRAQQIRSIEWDEEAIKIRYDRGKVGLLADQAFEEPLARLFELNPAIEAEDDVRRTLGVRLD